MLRWLNPINGIHFSPPLTQRDTTPQLCWKLVILLVISLCLVFLPITLHEKMEQKYLLTKFLMYCTIFIDYQGDASVSLLNVCKTRSIPYCELLENPHTCYRCAFLHWVINQFVMYRWLGIGLSLDTDRWQGKHHYGEARI